jgi:hypothetical protein
MNNPWNELPSAPPYILPRDQRSLVNLAAVRINDRAIPEPFIGNPHSAAVVLLSLNPGDSPGDAEAHKRVPVRNSMLRNLCHNAGEEYPFYSLNPDPDFATTPCANWWIRHLHELIDKDKGGLDRRTVARHLCVIEWFPYHSLGTDGLPETFICPSQMYSFDLARRALATAQLVVGMRGQTRWQNVDKRLGEIPYLKNPRNPTVSIGNTPVDEAGRPLFWRIVSALRNGHQ